MPRPANPIAIGGRRIAAGWVALLAPIVASVPIAGYAAVDLPASEVAASPFAPVPPAAPGAAGSLTPIPPHDKRPVAEEWATDPGTTMVLVEDHRVPLVDVRLDFAAGRWSPWFIESRAGEAFEAQMDDPSGTLRRRAAALGIDITLRAGSMSSSLSFTCLSENLAGALQLVRDLLRGADYDRKELARRGRRRDIEWRASLKDPEFRLMQTIARLLYRERDPRRSPYEKPPSTSSEVRRLIAARDTLIRLPGRIVGFAGDLTREEASALAATLLPPSREEPDIRLAPALDPIAEASARPRRERVPMPRLTQAYFGVARDSLRYADPGYPASLIADSVLGGSFYSRLNVALRVEGGDTYSAETSSTGGLHRGLWSASSYTRSANAEAAVKKMRDALDLFRRAGITEEERAAAAGHILGEIALRRQSPRQILDARVRELRSNLPRGFDEESARRAGALPLGEINGFIERFYDPALFTAVEVTSR